VSVRFDARHQQQRRHDAFLAEAAEAGIEVGEAQTHELGSAGAGEQITQLVKPAVVGETKVRPTHLQLYALRAAFGPFMFARPFHGGDDLVGEFHVVVRGALPQPVCLVKRLIGTAWATNEDAALAATLGGDKRLAAAVKALEWKQHGPGGSTRLEWGVQLSCVTETTSHLAMQAASYGLIERRTGLRELVAVVDALAGVVSPTGTPVTGMYFEPAFTDLFYEVYATFDALWPGSLL
jgi:hypothetical protein